MVQFNSITNHNTDFRTFLENLLEAITIPQFYDVLNEAAIFDANGIISDDEFSLICETASILDPVLYNRWERGGEQ